MLYLYFTYYKPTYDDKLECVLCSRKYTSKIFHLLCCGAIGIRTGMLGKSLIIFGLWSLFFRGYFRSTVDIADVDFYSYHANPTHVMDVMTLP